MKKTKKKIIKKVKKEKDVFKFYNIKPFNCPIIFFYSDSSNNIAKHLNKKCNKDISKWLKRFIDKIPEAGKFETGYLTYSQDTGRPLILYIKRTKRKDWELYYTMIHEITHLVQHLEEYFAVNNEQELRAYLTESIFKDLRKLI